MRGRWPIFWPILQALAFGRLGRPANLLISRGFAIQPGVLGRSLGRSARGHILPLSACFRLSAPARKSILPVAKPHRSGGGGYCAGSICGGIGELTNERPGLASGALVQPLVLSRGIWLRGQDLNLRPSGYEPDELPGCSTPRQKGGVWPMAKSDAIRHARFAKEEFTPLAGLAATYSPRS